MTSLELLGVGLQARFFADGDQRSRSTEHRLSASLAKGTQMPPVFERQWNPVFIRAF